MKKRSSPPAVRPPMYHFSPPRTSRKPSLLLSLPLRLPPAPDPDPPGIGIPPCVRDGCRGTWPCWFCCCDWYGEAAVDDADADADAEGEEAGSDDDGEVWAGVVPADEDRERDPEAGLPGCCDAWPWLCEVWCLFGCDDAAAAAAAAAVAAAAAAEMDDAGCCCRKAARKEERKKGRCEEVIFGSVRFGGCAGVSRW